jgi:hypothetical protein
MFARAVCSQTRKSWAAPKKNFGGIICAILRTSVTSPEALYVGEDGACGLDRNFRTGLQAVDAVEPSGFRIRLKSGL